jgi:hypothetical protein
LARPRLKKEWPNQDDRGKIKYKKLKIKKLKIKT